MTEEIKLLKRRILLKKQFVEVTIQEMEAKLTLLSNSLAEIKEMEDELNEST